MISVRTILFALAISLDSLALMIVEGSMYRVIKRNDVVKQSIFVGLWQTLGFLLGSRTISWIIREGVTNYFPYSRGLYLFISFIIFVGLGVSMLKRGLKTDNIVEQRRESLNFEKIFAIAIITSVDALFAGLGLSFSGISISYVAFIILIVSTLSVIIGLFIGHRLGYKLKSNAYILSGIIFLTFGTHILFM